LIHSLTNFTQLNCRIIRGGHFEKKAVASAPSGGTEFGKKVKACAEQNIAATQEFVRDLSYAKDIQDMFRIQMEFMRTQMEAFVEQANSIGEAYMKSGSGQTRKPPRPDN
jgi:hypothetical protein